MTGFALILALLFGAPAPQSTPRITRAALSVLEKTLDGRFQKINATDPVDILGNTRAVYLAGYGAVFSAELSLIVTPNLNPFHQFFTAQEKARIHERKLQRLPVLRQTMREMLISSAASLENLPPNEQVVLAVTLFHYSWEDPSGIPAQIVMQAERQKLLSNSTRESSIRTVEF